MHALSRPPAERPGGVGRPQAGFCPCVRVCMSVCIHRATHSAGFVATRTACSSTSAPRPRAIRGSHARSRPRTRCAGFTDIGALCTRGAVTRGKGCCCISTLSCRGFVKCKWKKSCCDNCDSGFSDTGYGRGAGGAPPLHARMNAAALAQQLLPASVLSASNQLPSSLCVLTPAAARASGRQPPEPRTRTLGRPGARPSRWAMQTLACQSARQAGLHRRRKAARTLSFSASSFYPSGVLSPHPACAACITLVPCHPPANHCRLCSRTLMSSRPRSPRSASPAPASEQLER